jgi:hypothetical protein
VTADRTANVALWNRLEVSDKRYLKKFDTGKFKGVSVDPIYNIKRVTEELGPVGYAWGWEIKSERSETFGEGQELQTIHTAVVRAWFRQEDGSLRHVEHVGTTKLAYWTSAKPGKPPRFEVDAEAPKKSVTDALKKIMVSLGASADIWLGRFDGDKYVPPQAEDDPHDPETGEVRAAPARPHDRPQAREPASTNARQHGNTLAREHAGDAPPALANGRGWSVTLPGETKPFGPLPLQDAWAVLYRACKGEPNADGLNAAEIQEAKDVNRALYDAVTPKAKAALDELLAQRSPRAA